jgi:hypothetical protein
MVRRGHARLAKGKGRCSAGGAAAPVRCVVSFLPRVVARAPAVRFAAA